MISIVIILVLIAYYILYNTSKRAVKIDALGIEPLVRNNIFMSKIVSCLLLVISYLLLIFICGFAVATFTFIILLMTFGSLITLLTPLKYINFKNVALLVILLLSTEFVFNLFFYASK